MAPSPAKCRTWWRICQIGWTSQKRTADGLLLKQARCYDQTTSKPSDALMNPLSYLLISLGLTSIVLAIIFFIAWRSFGRRSHSLFWSIAFFFAALQWALNISSQKLPVSFELYWMLVSFCSAITLSLSVAGFRARVGLPNRLIWYIMINAIVLVATAYFLLVDPHIGLRTAIGPLYASIMMVACIHAIVRPQRLEPAEWGMIVSAGIFGLCEAAAAIAIFGGGASGSPESLELYRAINFLSLPAAYTGMGLFTVLIIASDMSKEMKTLALSDALTGVTNLRGFKAAASHAFAFARRRNSLLSVIVCDIDHFKLINDRFGHAVGDVALVAFARHLQKNARAEDIIGRVGGEEFIFLLPDTTAETSVSIAERTRTSLSALDINHEGVRIEVQASFGVTVMKNTDSDIDALLKRADEALYQSKRNGRNRVSTAL
jgi:diguanylate cyclase (GGDEF)-like protein